MEAEELHDILEEASKDLANEWAATNPEESKLMEELHDLYFKASNTLFQVNILINKIADLEKTVTKLHPEDYDSENWEGQEDDLADHLI